MGPVSSKKFNRKRVFWDRRSFTPGHFCPQSCHLVRLAKKIGEVGFSTKIQTKNVFLGKTNSRGLLRQNWAKFSSGRISPLNGPYSQLGPEKRYGASFIKIFQPKTCFLGWTNVITPFLPTGFSRVSARKTRQPGPSQHDPTKPHHIKYSHEEGPGHISQGLTKLD